MPTADRRRNEYVASRSGPAVDWTNATLLDGDLPAAVARIKDEHREVHTIGSADLVQRPDPNNALRRITP